MYLLTFNADSNEIHAGIGGVITHSEGQVLIAELEALIELSDTDNLTVELDSTRVSRFAEGAIEEIDRFKFICATKNIKLVNISVEEDAGEMSPNVRAILEGNSSELFELTLAS